jgi:hypothetical protein
MSDAQVFVIVMCVVLCTCVVGIFIHSQAIRRAAKNQQLLEIKMEADKYKMETELRKFMNDIDQRQRIFEESHRSQWTPLKKHA